MTRDLKGLGFKKRLMKAADRTFGPVIPETHFIARVSAGYGDQFNVISLEGEYSASVRGKLKWLGSSEMDLPVVGDFVLCQKIQSNIKQCVITGIVERDTCFVRNKVGKSGALQPIAANIDYAFIVTSCNNEFNLRRIERYLHASINSGATPVIILNKIDLVEDYSIYLDDIASVAGSCAVYALSAKDNLNLNVLRYYFTEGETTVLLGSSGVGKSSIINSIFQKEILRTSEIQAHTDKGKHTTTHREMYFLPSGGIIIDCPGMRELGATGEHSNFSGSFADIESIASNCKYSNCKHESEPGCAIKESLKTGVLDRSRYNSYLKLQKEVEYHAEKQRVMEHGGKRKRDMPTADFVTKRRAVNKGTFVKN